MITYLLRCVFAGIVYCRQLSDSTEYNRNPRIYRQNIYVRTEPQICHKQTKGCSCLSVAVQGLGIHIYVVVSTDINGHSDVLIYKSKKQNIQHE